jgi:hypothetical protein
MAFPEREKPAPLAPLMHDILEYGILSPLVVRPCGDNNYIVLKGRRILRAVWELQNNGHEKKVRWLPCYVIESDGPLMDLKLFLMLHSHDPFSPGDFERALASIEQAENQLPAIK